MERKLEKDLIIIWYIQQAVQKCCKLYKASKTKEDRQIWCQNIYVFLRPVIDQQTAYQEDDFLPQIKQTLWTKTIVTYIWST